MRKTPAQIAWQTILKLAEVSAMPQPPEVAADDNMDEVPEALRPDESRIKSAKLSPIELRELRNDLASQYDLQGEEAALRAAPSQAVADALREHSPSLKSKILFGAGGGLGGAALGGGLGALSSYFSLGSDKMLKPTIAGALLGTGGGVLSGLHYLRKRKIQEALESVNQDKTASSSMGLLKLAAEYQKDMC